MEHAPFTDDCPSKMGDRVFVPLPPMTGVDAHVLLHPSLAEIPQGTTVARRVFTLPNQRSGHIPTKRMLPGTWRSLVLWKYTR